MKTILQALFLLLATSVISVSAATFVVNTTADTIDVNLGNGTCADASANCSLRAAISEANALAGADVITLGAVAYTQSLVASNENSNAGGDWDITSQITINGVSQASTFLQAAAVANTANERVLEVLPGGDLTLANVTVRHGRYNTIGSVAGGGIANTGTLFLNGVTVRDNQANSLEGSSIGGGIYNGGLVLTLIDTTVTANKINATLPGAGFGGGVGSSTSLMATITISNSSVSGNTLNSLPLAGSGGGLYLGGVFNLIAGNSHFDNNTVNSSGGGEGGGARLVSIVSPALFNISGCTFNGNTINNSSASAVGAGLHLYTSSSTLSGTLDRVSIDGNRAQGNEDSRGGGLYVNPVGAAINLDVTNSSISQNTNDGTRGGGVELSNRNSMTPSDSFVNFTNTTISGNTAGTGNGGVDGKGGGIHLEMSAATMSLNLNFVTITDNFAILSGGGVSNVPGNSIVNVKNTIIAGNGAGSNGQDISGALFSQDYNHIQNLIGAQFPPAAHDTSGFDPQLGLLQNNGGPTLTHLLAAPSPLLGTIPLGINGCGAAITIDQRGVGRPFGSGCDKGSTEFTGPWNLSGVIRTTTGIPIRNAAVTISGGSLPAPVTVFTGNFGTYQFTNLAGSEYTVTVTVKRYHFNEASQVFALSENITNADFIANAPFSREVFDLSPAPVKGKSLR